MTLAKPLPAHLQLKLTRTRKQLRTGAVTRADALGVVATQIVKRVMPSLTAEPRLALAAMWLDG